MYLRDLFPELQGNFILLQQNVGWPRRSEEIANMAKRNDRRNFCIIFNGSLFPDCPESYLQHKAFLDYCDLDKLVASADIGLVFYLDDNENDALISHASGQLSHFAMLGVPVVASYTPSLERLMKKYEFGILVNSVEEIYPAAEKIMRNYDRYCAGALACFDAEYDIANYQEHISSKLRELV